MQSLRYAFDELVTKISGLFACIAFVLGCGGSPIQGPAAVVLPDDPTQGCNSYTDLGELCEAFRVQLRDWYDDRWQEDWSLGECELPSVGVNASVTAVVVPISFGSASENQYGIALFHQGRWHPIATRQSDNRDGTEDSCLWSVRAEAAAGATLVRSSYECTIPTYDEDTGAEYPDVSGVVTRLTVVRHDLGRLFLAGDFPVSQEYVEEALVRDVHATHTSLVIGAWSDNEGGGSRTIALDGCRGCAPLCGFEDLEWGLALPHLDRARGGCVVDADCEGSRCTAHRCSSIP